MHGTAHGFTLLCSLEGHDSNSTCEQWHQQKAAVPYTGHVLPRQLLSLSWEGITGEEYLRWDVHAVLPDLCPSERPDRILHYVQCCEMTAQMSSLVASGSCLVYEIFQPNSSGRGEHIPQSQSSFHSCDSCGSYYGEKQFSMRNTAVILSTVYH